MNLLLNITVVLSTALCFVSIPCSPGFILALRKQDASEKEVYAYTIILYFFLLALANAFPVLKIDISSFKDVVANKSIISLCQFAIFSGSISKPHVPQGISVSLKESMLFFVISKTMFAFFWCLLSHKAYLLTRGTRNRIFGYSSSSSAQNKAMNSDAHSSHR